MTQSLIEGQKFKSGDDVYEVEWNNDVSINLQNTSNPSIVILISKNKKDEGSTAIHKLFSSDTRETYIGISLYDMRMVSEVLKFIN